MKTPLSFLLMALCLSACYGMDKYIVLKDGTEIRCDFIEVTDEGFKATIDKEERLFKSSEASIKFVSSPSEQSSSPAPVLKKLEEVPVVKKPVDDGRYVKVGGRKIPLYKYVETLDRSRYTIRNGVKVPTNISIYSPDGKSASFIST